MSSKTGKSFASSRWENEGGAMRPPTHDAKIAQKLADYGITTVQLTAYEWSGYRYTNMKDAIAAAKGLAR
jgi:hypothetical protein